MATLRKHAVDDPHAVISNVVDRIGESIERRRKLGSSGSFVLTGNPIDDCWRRDPNWENNRQTLADCGVGFGKDAMGGKGGRLYVVTDASDDDLVNPRNGTLRHAVTRAEPLWIIFQEDMTIRLQQELIMASVKTIDARGVKVHITGKGCITVQYVSNVIIHGLSMDGCTSGTGGMIRSSEGHYGWRTKSDGDAINIFGSSHVWIDHNTLSNCADGLVDALMGSTAITISNNHFSKHNEVMMLGAHDLDNMDRSMQVTIAFNHFGEGLQQRMP
ncbi:unnamed protein product, partial [Cuscuta europaea]